MSLEKIFFFETLIENINFKSPPVPDRDDVEIYISVDQVFELRSTYDTFGKLDVDENPNPLIISYFTGKSYFFTYAADLLRESLRTNPLTISIYGAGHEFNGMATVPWADAFIQMVNENVTYTNVNSNAISFRDDIDLLRGSKKIGSLCLFVRLTCFGKMVTTYFQVDEDTSKPLQPRQFFFKGSEGDVVFQSQKFGLVSSQEILPLAPLFNTPVGVGDNVSYETVLQDSKASQFSYFAGMRKSVDKYNIQNMTFDQIKKFLCKNPDCLGNKNFSEFGMSTEKCKLTTNKKKKKSEKIDPLPRDHSLAHALTSFDTYGPSSSFRRPKRIDLPFVPKDKPLRLRGGGEGKKKSGKGKCEIKESEEDLLNPRPFDVDKLASMNVQDPKATFRDYFLEMDELLRSFKESFGPCGMTTCSYAPVIMEESCKNTCHVNQRKMDYAAPKTAKSKKQDQKIDCSLVVCNAIRVCPFGLPNENEHKDKVSACGIPDCPHSRKLKSRVEKNFKLLQIKPACGHANCPFAKKIVGTATEDDMIALQHLSERPVNKCGKVACTYYVPEQVPLPPIHWDCPEPLPRGNCTNPDCPHLPAILRKLRPKTLVEKIDDYFNNRVGKPCACPNCSYCSPCGNPCCWRCCSPPSPPLQPPCKPIKKSCNVTIKGKSCSCNKSSRKFTGRIPPCGNPCCLDGKKSDGKTKKKVICSNLQCPGSKNNVDETTDEEEEDGCRPPERRQLEGDDSNVPCKNPNCRFAVIDDEICVNPKCAYNNEDLVEFLWCRDDACCLDKKYKRKKSDSDLCKKMLKPKYSFTGYLYK